MSRHKSSFSLDLLLILLFFIIFKSMYFYGLCNFFPIHDTVSVVQTFSFLYSEFYSNNTIPLWDPYSLYGIKNDFQFLTAIAPAQYLFIIIGKLFHITNALTLFKLSVLLEELALLVGVYLLARRFFRERATLIFICIGTIATVYWGTQIWWNFRIYYLIPLWLYFIVKFIDEYDFKYLWISGIIAVVSLIGNLPYYAPLFLLLSILFILFLILTKTDRPKMNFKSAYSASSLVLLLVLIVVSLVYIDFARHVFDYLQSYSPGREADGSTSLKTFLTYGGFTEERSIWEYFFAVPFCNDFFIYFGLLPLVFLVYGFIHTRRNPYFSTLVLVSFVLILFSRGSHGGIASLLYYVFPGMDYFRHVGYVKEITKILLLVASGFGLDYYLASRKSIGDNNESNRIRYFSPSSIGMFLIIIIVTLNLSGFSKFYYNKIRYPFDKMPFTFAGYSFYDLHLFFIFLLFIFIIILSRRYLPVKAIPYVILLFYMIEITTYSAGIYHLTPVRYGNTNIVSTKIRKHHKTNIELYHNAYIARKHDFIGERLLPMDLREASPEMSAVLQSYSHDRYVTYFNVYSAFAVDSCLQEFRVDYITKSFDHLIRARYNIPLDKKLTNVMPGNESIVPDFDVTNAVRNDDEMLKAIGCNTNKIRFVSNPEIVSDYDAAARVITEPSKLSEKLVIFSAGATKFPVPGYVSKPAASTKYLDVKYNVEQFSANMIEIAADLGSFENVWLLYLDNYHPGWKATVNGNPVSIEQGNIAFKAVKLVKGKNRVKFVFENPRCRVYLLMSFLVGIIGSILLLMTVIRILVNPRTLPDVQERRDAHPFQ